MSSEGEGMQHNTHLSQRARHVVESPISGLMRRALEDPRLISLAAGFVDQTSLPVEAARSAALAALSEPEAARAALQYGSTAGHPGLRRQVLAHVLAQDAAASGGGHVGGPVPDDEQIILTAGSNQILTLLADALLDPGDHVLCDAPTYFVFTGLVQSVGAQCVGVASDEGGMRIDALERTLADYAARGELARVKAIYVMSYFDNPRGISLARERRAALVALAERYSREQRIYVIEDAAYRELRFEGDDLPSLRSLDVQGQSVIYAGTFSKSFSPGVRVGYGIFPRELGRIVLALKGYQDFGSPHFNQCLVSSAFSLGLYAPHVALLRDVYKRKAECTVRALDAELKPLGIGRYQRPMGGLYVWLELPTHIDTGPSGVLFARALELGVLYVPGEYCFPDGAQRAGSSARASLRLSFGAQSDARIAEGVALLARAISQL
ncbi:MAG: PLP-dependent aminotransferase family protein [Polyangiales bacterium]